MNLFWLVTLSSVYASFEAYLEKVVIPLGLNPEVYETSKKLLSEAFSEKRFAKLLKYLDPHNAGVVSHPEIFPDMRVLNDSIRTQEQFLDFIGANKIGHELLAKVCDSSAGQIIRFLQYVKEPLSSDIGFSKFEKVLIEKFPDVFFKTAMASDHPDLVKAIEKYDNHFLLKLKAFRSKSFTSLQEIIDEAVSLASHEDLEAEKIRLEIVRKCTKFFEQIVSPGTLVKIEEILYPMPLKSLTHLETCVDEANTNSLGLSKKFTKIHKSLIPEALKSPQKLTIILKLSLRPDRKAFLTKTLMKTILRYPSIKSLDSLMEKSSTIEEFTKKIIKELLINGQLLDNTVFASDDEWRLLTNVSSLDYPSRLLIYTKCSKVEDVMAEADLLSKLFLTPFSKYLTDFIPISRTKAAPSRYERQISDLGLEITWEDFQTSDDVIAWSPFTNGFVNVPTNYRDPNCSSRVGIRVRRHTDGLVLNKAVHVILVDGGPGGRTRFNNHRYKFKDYVVFYTFDHRGVGDSGSEGLKKKANERSFHDLKPEFVTMHNTAMDIGVIVNSIRKQFPNARIIVEGSSYGAQLSAKYNDILPNGAEAIVADGAPGIFGLTQPDSFHEYIRDCELDLFCRSKMGTDVTETMNHAIKRVMQRDTNACTITFHHHGRSLCGDACKDGPLPLRSILHGILYPSSKNSKYRSHGDKSLVQILFPLIKATSDCTDVRLYRKTVFKMFKKTGRTESIQRVSLSVFKLVQFMDIRGFNESTPPSDPPHDLASLFWTNDDARIWQGIKSMFPLASNMVRSGEKPPNTSYTEWFSLSCRKDTVAPPNASYDLMKKTEAPLKRWLLLPQCGHCKGEGICYDLFLLQAYFGLVIFDLAECLNMEEIHQDRMHLDWKFKGWDLPSTMWEAVRTELSDQDSHLVFSHLPSIPALA